MTDRPLDDVNDAGAEAPTGRRDREATILAFPTVARPAPERDEILLRDVLGDVLRDERLGQERTLADVADAANVSLPYLSEVERGRKEVSSDLLDAICDSLDLTLADVLERSTRRLRSGSVGGSGMQMLAA